MDNYLQHHGILGQKWGVRRYQNEDGSLTPAGKERKSLKDRIQENKENKKIKKAGSDAMDAYYRYERDKTKAQKLFSKEAAGKKQSTKKYEKLVKNTLKNEAILQKSLKEIDNSVVSFGKDRVEKVLSKTAEMKAHEFTYLNGYYMDIYHPEWHERNSKVVDYALNRPGAPQSNRK